MYSGLKDRAAAAVRLHRLVPRVPGVWPRDDKLGFPTRLLKHFDDVLRLLGDERRAVDRKHDVAHTKLAAPVGSTASTKPKMQSDACR